MSVAHILNLQGQFLKVGLVGSNIDLLADKVKLPLKKRKVSFFFWCRRTIRFHRVTQVRFRTGMPGDCRAELKESTHMRGAQGSCSHLTHQTSSHLSTDNSCCCPTHALSHTYSVARHQKVPHGHSLGCGSPSPMISVGVVQ